MPTIDEAGVKGYDMGYWFAAYVPAKTPPPVVARLRELLVAGTKSADREGLLREHRRRRVDDARSDELAQVPGRRGAEVGPRDQGGRHRARVIVHLVDGTYELFRHFYGLRRFNKGKDRPFGAVVGVLQTVLQMIESGATHVGVATDHVIESFRNDLWPGYKTGGGIEPALFAQFHPLEEALAAMGVVVWPMVELEADDALASAAHLAAADPAVEKVCIWTPDKDLAQCVRGDRVVQVDRRGKAIRDAAGVREKFGVEPALIPDYLALVGDAADGYPGIPGIGAVGAARLLNRHGAIESVSARRCSASAASSRCCSRISRRCAPTRRCSSSVEELRWRGPTAAFAAWTRAREAPRLLERCLKASAAVG